MPFALALLLHPTVTSALAAIPQEQSQTNTPQNDVPSVTLEPAKPLERNLQGGQQHTYEIRAEAGFFVHAVVEQLGIDVVLTLYAPDGKPIASMDSPNGNFGPEQISTITDAAGIYKLQVASGDKNVPAGRYRVTVDPVRAPGDRDRARIAAERMFFEAVQLHDQRSTVSTQDAIQKFVATLPLWRAAGDSYEEALTHSAIAGVYDALGEKQRALDYYSRAVPLEHAAGDHSGEAETLNNIGLVYDALGEEQKALDYYAQALSLRRALGDRSGEGITLSNMGLVYDGLGEKRKALEYYSQALPLERAVGNQYGEALTLNNIGMVYGALGEKQKALEYYALALPLHRAAGNRSGEGTTLSNIGLAYNELGEKGKALDSYSRALILDREIGDRSAVAITLSRIGLTYDELGEKQKALDYYAQALPLQRAVEDLPGEATTLTYIGNVYYDLGEKQKALDYYTRALPLRRAVGDRSGEAVTLNNLGLVYDALGEREKALDNYHQVLLIERAVGERNGEAATLSNIGIVYARLGDKHKALEYYDKALALCRAVQNPLGQAQVLSDLMGTWRDLKQPETAVFFGKLAVNVIQQVRSNIRGLEKDAQQSFLSSKEQMYRYLANVLISLGRLSEAEQVLDLLKDEEYFQFVRRDARQAASLTAPVELTKAESELNGKYEERANRMTTIGNEWVVLQAKPLRTSDEEKQLADLSTRLDNEKQSWDEFLGSLDEQLAQSREAKTSDGNLQQSASRMQSVVRELGPGIVALYTLASEDKYRVILVTADKQVAREYPIRAADLNKKAAAFREALLDPRSDPAPKARELYDILVGPLANDLEDAQATTLMWSLDGVLRYLPLAALHDGHAYLVEKYLNVVFTPASIALLGAHPGVEQRHGLGVGVSKPYGGMPGLPAVPAELHAVIREQDTSDSTGVMSGHTLLDDTFTTDNFKASLSQKYELVHIASHFVYGAGDDTESYLLLGGKDAQGQKLTLADINNDPKISFSNVELLTLSACNTAINIPGDGHEVDGLGMLAQRKGAKAVMATLWSVDDSSTGILMQTFYRNWTTGSPLSKAEALRRAQVAFLHGTADQPASSSMPPYAHPYFWAPFILIGNWQ